MIKIPDHYWTGEPLFKAGLPWLTPRAIKRLNEIVNQGLDVLEFGSGGSTIFFSRRCNSVLTWEPSLVWRQKLADLVDASKSSVLKDLPFILNLHQWFDIVLVDNRDSDCSRQKLAPLVLQKVSAQGYFILDNYGRYRLDFLSGWNCEYYDDPHWDGKGTLIATHN